MIFDPLPLLDRADNPYMPRYLQDIPLHLDPGEFAISHFLSEFPPGNTGLMDGNHGSAVSTVYPTHNDMDVYLDDFDDNSSDSLDPLEDHEFPDFFTQRGSPPRLFHSHGTYRLPVDGDEMKVCVTRIRVQYL
jgi:hypothetical protein